MALTIAIEGKGVIANCDVLVNDTGGTGTGDWTEEGGGTMTLTPDVFLYGSSSIAGKYANKDGFQQFDLGVGNELDFTASTGTEAGQMIYMWVNMAAFAVLDDISTGGLFIRVSSSSPGTTNYLDYCIAGGNGSSNGVSANGWTGGWKLFVVDPLQIPTRSNGTQSSIVASVVTMGLFMETWDSVRAESVFIDQIAVGSGLRITGTSTTGWQDVMEYCTDYTNRAWGMVQERDGIYYLFGKMYIGDTAQSADTSFADSGRILQFGTSQYYNSSSAWVSTMPTTACGIVVEDHASYKTTFTDGVIVGTDNGRSGSTIIGNADQNISLDLHGGNHADSATLLYGTTLSDILGTINSGNDTGHKFLGASFIGCSQFDPIGAPVIRNCTFAETVSTNASIIWNSSIDIESCSFIANTTGAGIEHDVSGSYDYTEMTFSGNTYDIENSCDASQFEGASASDTSFSLNGTNNAVGQSFVGDGKNITKADFRLSKVGSPTGNVVAKLYAHTGTYGTSSLPTGSPLATSDEIVASTLQTTPTAQLFDFNTIYNLTNATNYVIVLEYTSGDGSNYVDIEYEVGGPLHAGNMSYYTTSWVANAYDLRFTVYSDGLVIVNATDSDPSSSEETGTWAGITQIKNSVNLTVTVKDASGSLVENAQVAIFQVSDDTQLMNEDTLSTGIASESFNYPGSEVDIYYRVRKSSGLITYNYHIDTSDSGPTDTQAVWTGDANAFDGSSATEATTTTGGSDATNNLAGAGTNAPSTGSDIVNVKARMYGSITGTSVTLYSKIYQSDDTLLGTLSRTSSSDGYTDYTTLTEPSGGWDWAEVQGLKTKLYAEEPAGSAVTYYMDGSDAVAYDPNTVWNSETNTDDGSISTFGSCSDVGTISSNYVIIEGTDAPSSGNSITQVRARIYGDWSDSGGTGTVSATVFTDSLGENLGTATINAVNGSPHWSDYVTLSTPSGGWTWAKVQALEVKAYLDTAVIAGQGQVYRVDIEVTPTGGSLTEANVNEIDIQVNTGTTDTRYKNFSGTGKVDSNGFSASVRLAEDDIV